MKRDLDLIRKIFEEIEKLPVVTPQKDLEIEGHDPQEIAVLG